MIELMVALAISALLLTGVLRITVATSAGFQAQQAGARTLEDTRFALRTIATEVRAAGYQPEGGGVALGTGTADRISETSDRLVLRRQSDQNCHGTTNTQTGADGQPLPWLLINTFEASGGDLRQTCRYGASEASLVTQINRYGLMHGIAAFQVLLAEDFDQDGQVDHWVKAGEQQHENQLLGVRFAFLTVTDTPAIGQPVPGHRVLDEFITPGPGNKVARVFESTVAIRGRL
jgi:hypothetical protein